MSQRRKNMLHESPMMRTSLGTARESQSQTVLRFDVNPFVSRPKSVWRVFHCSEHGLINSRWADVPRVPHFLHEAAQQPSLGLTATTAFPSTSRFTRCSSASATRARASSALLVPCGSSAFAPPFSANPWPNDLGNHTWCGADVIHHPHRFHPSIVILCQNFRGRVRITLPRL